MALLSGTSAVAVSFIGMPRRAEGDMATFFVISFRQKMVYGIVECSRSNIYATHGLH